MYRIMCFINNDMRALTCRSHLPDAYNVAETYRAAFHLAGQCVTVWVETGGY